MYLNYRAAVDLTHVIDAKIEDMIVRENVVGSLKIIMEETETLVQVYFERPYYSWHYIIDYIDEDMSHEHYLHQKYVDSAHVIEQRSYLNSVFRMSLIPVW